MKIKLSDIKSYIISLESSPDLEIVLHESGYSDVTVMPGTVYHSSKEGGISFAHYNVLKNATTNPFIIFEEDSRFFRQCDEIDIPDDADAIYLGVAIGQFLEELKTDPVEEYAGVHRVYNPLGAHAILYLSENFAEAAEKVAARAATGRGATRHVDAALNTINHKFNIYAIDPIFYQHNHKNPLISNYSRIVSLETKERDPIF